MLTKAILNCIRKKYGMEVRISDKGHENLLPNTEEEEEDEQGNSGECEWCTALVLNRSPPRTFDNSLRKFHPKGSM
jgi:hypothetical protein